MRSLMRHSCSVPPPPSAASSETLSIVHGSCGFHWKSTTCGKEGMAKGWDWKGGIVQEGSDKYERESQGIERCCCAGTASRAAAVAASAPVRGGLRAGR